MKKNFSVVALVVILAVALFVIFKKDDPGSGKIENIDGEIVTLNVQGFEDLLNKEKGRIFFINIFASWCPPCQNETPDFVSVYKEYAEQGVSFVGLSVDTSKAAVKRYIDKYKVSYPIYRINNALQKELEAEMIPVTIVLDKEGNFYERLDGEIDREILVEIISELKEVK